MKISFYILDSNAYEKTNIIPGAKCINYKDGPDLGKSLVMSSTGSFASTMCAPMRRSTLN